MADAYKIVKIRFEENKGIDVGFKISRGGNGDFVLDVLWAHYVDPHKGERALNINVAQKQHPAFGDKFIIAQTADIEVANG